MKLILMVVVSFMSISLFNLKDASASEFQEVAPAAAGWQNLGTWSMKSVVAFGSDGGNLKACVAGTDKVTFNLARDIGIPLPGTLATTSGVSGDNCANWSGLSRGAYNLHKDNFRTVYHIVTVWD